MLLGVKTFNIKEKKIINQHFYPWLIWSIASLFFFTEYLARVAPSVMEGQLLHDLNLNATEFGLLSSFFYYAYVGMQLPVGALMDRYNSRFILCFSCFTCALGCYLFASSTLFYIAALGRFLTGFGGAFAFIGALKLATLWFPPSMLGMLAGATQAMGMLGAAAGEKIMNDAIHHLGWQSAMIITGHILALLAVIMGLLIREHPSQAKAQVKMQKPASGILQGLQQVFRNPQSWINGCYAGLIFAPTGAFAEVWGPTYLEHVRHISDQDAALINTFIFIGWGIGAPLTGKLSDWLGRRKPILIISALLSFLTFTIILYWPNLSLNAMLFWASCYGLANTGLVCSYAIAGEINPKYLSGISMAFANMASVIIGVLFLPLIGHCLDWQWQGAMHAGIRVYASSDYQWAILPLIFCLIIAIICSFFIKETYCHNIEDNPC
jgi:MFS family permease